MFSNEKSVKTFTILLAKLLHYITISTNPLAVRDRRLSNSIFLFFFISFHRYELDHAIMTCYSWYKESLHRQFNSNQ